MEITEDEAKFMTILRTLGPAPKADSKEDLHQWMKDYLTSQDGETQSAASQSVYVPAVTPRLPVFSGKKSDASFELWLYEVQCLQERQPNSAVIWEAVHRSLRDEPAHIAMRLGTKATLKQLLDKLQSVYGDTQETESTMMQLYNAKQNPDESLSQWSCRVEGLVAKARRLGTIGSDKEDETLRSRFYHGLKSSIKDRTAHKFDAAETFDDLRREIRQVEAQLSGESKESTARVTAKAAQSDSVNARLDAQDAKLQEISERLQVLANPSVEPGQTVFQQQQGIRPQQQNRPPYQQQQGRGAPRQQQSFQPPPSYTQPHSQSYVQPHHQKTGYSPPPQQNPSYAPPPPQATGPGVDGQAASSEPFTCYRCGGLNHIARHCRARLDHSWRDYGQAAGNGGGSANRGGRR